MIYYNGAAFSSVAMAQDGNTIAIGYAFDNGTHRCYYISSAIEIYDYNVDDDRWKLRSPPVKEKGSRVALSKDGMVLATGQYFGGGMVEIFQFNNDMKNWVSIGEITNEFETGDKSDYFFGYSLTLSNDGQVVAIGHPGKLGTYNYVQDDDWDPKSPGLTHIYKYEGDSTWNQLGQPIMGETAARSGTAVSLSGDGSTIAIISAGDFYGYKNQHVSTYRFIDQEDEWLQMGEAIEQEENGDPILVALSTSGIYVTVTFSVGRGHEKTFFVYKYDDDVRNWFQLPQNDSWEIYGAVVISIKDDTSSNIIFKHVGRGAVTSDNGRTVAVRENDIISVFDSILEDSTVAPSFIISPTVSPSISPVHAGVRNKKSNKKSGTKKSNKKSAKKSSKDTWMKSKSSKKASKTSRQ